MRKRPPSRNPAGSDGYIFFLRNSFARWNPFLQAATEMFRFCAISRWGSLLQFLSQNGCGCL